MKFEFKHSEQNPAAVQKFARYIFNPTQSKIIVAGLPAMLLWYAILITTGFAPIVGFLVMIGIAAVCIFTIFARLRAIFRSLKNADIYAGISTIEFTGTQYILSNDAMRHEVKLSHIYDVVDANKLGLLVRLAKMDIVVIPQTAFESEEHKQQCLAELTSLIQAAKAKTAP